MVWLLLPLCSVLFLGLSMGCAEAGGSNPHPPVAQIKIQSVTFDAVRRPSPGALEHLRDMGVTHLTLISFGWQAGHDVPEVQLHNEARWFSEGDAGIRSLAHEADSLGLSIILKPHIWVRMEGEEGLARHRIAFDTEEKWRQWEDHYHRFMMHYAHLAQEIDAPVLVIGTELANPVRTRPDFFRHLIADIRNVYDGKLTYAANWWEDYEHVSFWDALDYIGVQAYFELSKANNPTLDLLKTGWEAPEAALQQLSKETGKPVLFTEIGYRNISYAAAQPWRWPERDEEAPQDDALQARLYEAFFASLWHEPWFAGAILWKWRPPMEDPEHDRRRRRPGTYLGFTPQDKPAEQVIARWFTGQAFRGQEAATSQ
ncbi:MAG TPA: hypothetical protein VKP65_04180 [Rhodothermales bacterium]|nr:hypothetical protein [Rhodothermales bacterium]